MSLRKILDDIKYWTIESRNYSNGSEIIHNLFEELSYLISSKIKKIIG